MSIRSLLIALCAASCIVPLPSSAAPKDPETRTLMGQCMKEVGAYYDRTYNRWWFSAGGMGSPQEQRYYDCLSRRYNETSRPRKATR